jgi:hypothetical protein
VIHPMEKQEKADSNGVTSCFLSLKPEAIAPHKVTKEDAERYFRHFCHIIDLSGGESPRKSEKVNRTYPSLSEQLQQLKEKRRIPRSTRKDDSG